MRPRARPGTQNNVRPTIDPLEAKNRNAQDQGPTTQRASVFPKKNVFINLPRGLWRILQDKEKKRLWPWAHFLQIKK